MNEFFSQYNMMGLGWQNTFYTENKSGEFSGKTIFINFP